MTIPSQKDTSDIEVRPMHRIARVPIHLTTARVQRLVGLLIGLDILFIAVFLIGTIAEVQALTATGRLASIDLAVSANLPWTYELAKLVAIATLCGLMTYSYAGDQSPDRFWKFGFIIGALLAIAHSARLYEIWAATVVPAFLGSGIDPSLSVAVGRLGLFVLLISAATTQFSSRSRGAAFSLCLAAILLLAAELSPPAALTKSDITEIFGPSAVATAWHVGLRLLGESLILSGLAFCLRDIQITAVRYVYRGGA